jgi:hypothetical protein
MTDDTITLFDFKITPLHIEATLRQIAAYQPPVQYPSPNAATVLRDISAAIKCKDHRRRGQLWNFAEQEFASLNGWRIGTSSFSPEKIGKRTREVHFHRDNVFDHCRYFHDHGKAIAIVAQPYGHVGENEATRGIFTSIATFRHIRRRQSTIPTNATSLSSLPLE